MGKKEEFNIFNQPGNKPEEKKGGGASVPVSEEKASPKSPSKAVPAIGDPELIDMLNRLRSMDEDLKKKMQRICELTGMTRMEIERFIENPKNFTDSQWTRMQREKELLEDKIYAAIGARAKKRIIQKKKVKMAKERKGKTLGGRKGWIQM